MGRPRIIEVDYYDFKAELQRATDTGKRIEKTGQPEAWAEYVKQNKISEVAMRSWGKSKFPNALRPRLVIINLGESWDGFYAYSPEDEAALKWVWEE